MSGDLVCSCPAPTKVSSWTGQTGYVVSRDALCPIHGQTIAGWSREYNQKSPPFEPSCDLEREPGQYHVQHGDEPATDWNRLPLRDAMPGRMVEPFPIEVERSTFTPTSENTAYVISCDPAYDAADLYVGKEGAQLRWYHERKRGFIAFRAPDPVERFHAELHACTVRELLGQLAEAYAIFGMACALLGASDDDDDDETPERLRERRRQAPRDLDDAAFALLLKLDAPHAMRATAQIWTGSIDDSKIVEETGPAPTGITRETIEAWATVLDRRS